jgi:hypothetical protein
MAFDFGSGSDIAPLYLELIHLHIMGEAKQLVRYSAIRTAEMICKASGRKFKRYTHIMRLVSGVWAMVMMPILTIS